MQILISSENAGQFSYQLNIENSASWDDVYSVLMNIVPVIKEKIQRNDSLGIGLQPSIQMINELSNPSAFAQIRHFLSQNQCYLYTIDGFNKDLFDWKDAKWLSYHNSLAQFLSKSLPPQITGSIASVPGTPKEFVRSDSDINQITQNWISHADYLIRLERETGKQIVLAIQPKAMSFLESAQEGVNFFNQHIFSTQSCSKLSKLLDVNQRDAEDLLRTHITLCVDIADVPEEYSSCQEFVKAIESQGTSVGKKQLHADSLNAANLHEAAITHINQIMEQFDEQTLWIDAKRAA